VSEGSLFHVELRQFPNTARKFNLTSEQLRERILTPWLQGKAIELEERRWWPEKARLTIYEGPGLSSDQIGLGRGWANVTRQGREVTAEVLEQTGAAAVTPADEALQWVKAEIIRRVAAQPRSLADVLDLLNLRYPRWRASDRLAVAERAVWELLHRGAVRMEQAGAAVDSADWEPAILDWMSWTDGEVTIAAA
jgi:hypothetical protein